MTKPPLVLLHGALGSQEQFQRLRPLLQANYEVHTLDFSGHGPKRSDTPFSIELFAHDVEMFMAENAIEKADFFGYSMGGYVALKLALDKPGMVRRLLTLGTKFDWTPISAAKEVKMLNPEKIEEKVPKFAEMLASRHGTGDWKNMMNKTAQMMLDLGAKPVLAEAKLKEIESQVFITLGEKDNMVGIDESRWACEHLAKAQFEQVDGFVHPIEQVDADRLYQLIRNFLD